jgi:transposase
MPTPYQSQILDHLGLVAGMFDELGIGDVIDRNVAQDASRRQVSVGQAVKAMVLNGLGFVNQQLYLVPRFFDNKPLERLIGPEIEAAHLNDDVLGRALDALYDVGVTPLYSLIATEACARLGLASPYVHLDTTSFHVDGRDNSAAPPEDTVIHITQGYSRDHRPDLNQVMLEFIVEHQAGLPLWMKPLSGNSSDSVEFGRVVDEHLAQLCRDDLPRYVVADSALYNAENLGKLATVAVKWITRVPATLNEGEAHLTNVDLATLAPLTDGYHYLEVSSSFGGVAQRWLVVYAEARQQRVQRTVDKQLAKQSDTERKAFKKLCAKTFACAADARQALEQCKATLAVSQIAAEEIRTMAHYGGRGRPAPGQPPERVDYVIAGSLASSLARRRPLVDQKSCFVLATNELYKPWVFLSDYICYPSLQQGGRRDDYHHLKRPRTPTVGNHLYHDDRSTPAQPVSGGPHGCPATASCAYCCRPQRHYTDPPALAQCLSYERLGRLTDSVGSRSGSPHRSHPRPRHPGVDQARPCGLRTGPGQLDLCRTGHISLPDSRPHRQ